MVAVVVWSRFVAAGPVARRHWQPTGAYGPRPLFINRTFAPSRRSGVFEATLNAFRPKPRRGSGPGSQIHGAKGP